MTAHSLRTVSVPHRAGAKRGKLLFSCAATAIAVVAVHPQMAKAQAAPQGAFRGTITGTTGTVSQTITSPDVSETITIGSSKATIDWSASQNDFLPSGTTATFLGSGVSDFTVLNRISAEGQVQLNGTVLGRLQGQANTPAGKIWFYAPGGILVGATAVFDVGGLLLTANNPTDFANSVDGFGRFDANIESNASVVVSQGAQINATSENSYVALIAPRVEQHGTVNVNGSVAYAAGQQMTMTLNQGLFDITIDVGTDDPMGVYHTGTTGGVASTGAGDNHAIFVTAVPKNQALQMLLRGNWGYGQAASASIENGAIYLSAGVRQLNVFNTNPVGSRIRDYRPATDQQASIMFQPGQVTSKLEGQATTNFELSTAGPSTGTFSEDVAIYGGSRADVAAYDGGLLDFDKNLLLFSYANGTPGVTRLAAFGSGELIVGGAATLQSGTPFSKSYPSEWNFVSGETMVEAAGGTIELGSLSMRASAVGETEGDVVGGEATLSVTGGGAVHVVGNATLTTTVSSFAGYAAQGGTSSVNIDGGTLTVGGNLDVLASGSNAGTSTSGGSPATGGTAQIWVGSLGGTLDVAGTARLSAVGTGAAGQPGTGQAGGSGTGGSAYVTVYAPETETPTVVQFGALSLSANATGGMGVGGDGFGVGAAATAGTARVEVYGGSFDVVGSTTLTANAAGGSGWNGGAATGGSAGIEVYDDTTDLGTSVSVQATAFGGHANLGYGGNGGAAHGGTAYIQANAYLGDIEVPASASTVTGGTVSLDVSGVGGNGGAGNGDNVAAGAGGAGHAGFYTGQLGSGGAFVLADASGATLNLGSVTVIANGTGGIGGAGGAGQAGGNGGAAFGGLAQAGLYDVYQTELRNGTTTFADLSMEANATGGVGGSGPAGSGNGGAATAGGTVINAKGAVHVGNLAMEAIAGGGSGANGGAATGGETWLETHANGGSIHVNGSVSMDASGTGGVGVAGLGGTGTGGQTAAIIREASSMHIAGSLEQNADGTGGAGSAGGGAGVALGGPEIFGGAGVVSWGTLSAGSISASASGTGGAGTGASSAGGHGTGGFVDVVAIGGGTMTLGSAALATGAVGGSTSGTGNGGNATAGTVTFGADGGTVNLTGTMRGHAEAEGGAASGGGNGGNAQAGTVSVIADAGGTLNARYYTDALATAEGGAATGGGNGGSATGGTAEVRANGGTINYVSTSSGGGSDTWIFTDAFGGNGVTGGAAQGGTSRLLVQNGGRINASGPDTSVGEFVLTATATGGFGTLQDGAETGGTAIVTVASGTAGVTSANVRDIYAEAATVDVTVSGAQASLAAPNLNLAGGAIDVSAENGGQINVGSLDAQATGSVSVAESGGGNINVDYASLLGGNVTLAAMLDALGISIDSAGSFFTGNLSAQEYIWINAGGTAFIDGLVSAPEIRVSSSDIAIWGQLGEAGITQFLELHAVSGAPVIIGGEEQAQAAVVAAAEQYWLSQNEIERIEAAEVEFSAHGIGDAADPDVVVRDVTIGGTQTDGGGVGDVELHTGGTVFIEGIVHYADAGATDAFTIEAGAIQVNTDTGGIGMTDSGGDLSGILTLDASNIWVADGALLEQLNSNPDFSGRQEALATNNGEANPDGFVRAGTIVAVVGERLLVQNSGTATAPAGLTVGDGGLTLASYQGDEATAIIHGRQVKGDGTVVSGGDFLEQIVFADSSAFSDDSRINFCAIGAACGGGGETIVDPVIGGPESILGPIGMMDGPLDGSEESQEEEEESEDGEGGSNTVLGPISNGELLNDQIVDAPVTSGSDSGQWDTTPEGQ